MTKEDFIGESVSYEPWGQTIWGNKSNGEQQMVLNLRGWGMIQYEFDTKEEAQDFQDNTGEWIAEAINEKILRDRNKLTEESLKQE
jgi:hypothetical protein